MAWTFLGVPASYMKVESPGDIVYQWQLGRVGCGLPIALGAVLFLTALGFGEKEIDALATGAEPQYRVIKNAPVDIGRDEIKSLFRAALRYW